MIMFFGPAVYLLPSKEDIAITQQSQGKHDFSFYASFTHVKMTEIFWEFLTTEREVNAGHSKYDALFGINGHFSVCPEVVQAALKQWSKFVWLWKLILKHGFIYI